MHTYLRPALVVMAVVTAACGAPGAAQPDQPATDTTSTVDVENIAFKPQTLTVLRSTTVSWVNRDSDVRHTATSGAVGDGGVPGVAAATASTPDGLFDGDLPEAGAEFAFTFDQAGTYEYFCEIHPSMVGVVVVE